MRTVLVTPYPLSLIPYTRFRSFWLKHSIHARVLVSLTFTNGNVVCPTFGTNECVAAHIQKENMFFCSVIGTIYLSFQKIRLELGMK